MIPLEELVEPQLKQFNLFKNVDRSDPTFLPLHVTGGIGDVIMSIDAIRFLQQKYQVIVYTHHIEAFKYFYQDSIPVFKDIPAFSWTMEFNTIAKFHTTDSFHGFLIKDHEELFLQQQKLFGQEPKLRSLVMSYFNQFFLIANYAKIMGLDRRDFPMFALGFDSRPEFEIVPRGTKEKIITIHDGFDIHNASIVSGRATKTWKWEHWNKLVRLLKLQFPNHKIIQLGATTAREIDGVDSQMVNKTSLIECFDILARSSFHIDGDSGLVHAATRLGVPCIVLWGPTPYEFYGYPQNKNLHSGVCKSACYGVKQNWNDKCVIGYPAPKCMDEILPEQVLSAAQEI